MNISIHKLVISALVALVILNIWVYCKGIGLSDEIQTYEIEIHKLEKENGELEAQIYSTESIAKTASLAAELSFESTGTPLYGEVPQVAYQR